MEHAHLEGSYNPYFVILSFLIAIMASYTALDLARRVTLSGGWKRALWLISGASAMGIGTWGMHFVAMLAFELEVKVTYRLPIVAVSVLVAAVASFGGLFAVSGRTFSWSRMLLGGGFMGAGIAGMHYTGMAAMEGVRIDYAPVPVELSILIAFAASLLALLLSFRLRDRLPYVLHTGKIASGVVMGLGIGGMHFTGMAGASFSPDQAESGLPLLTAEASVLAVYVAAGSILALMSVLVSSYFADKRMAEQTALGGSILESALDCILLTDGEGRVTEFNPSAEQAFGVGRARALQLELRHFIRLPMPRQEAGMAEALARLAAEENRIEAYGIHADGYEFPIELAVTRVRKPGPPVYTACVRDITVRKQAESALKESEERYRRLVDFSPEAIILHRDGIVLFANEATLRLVGISDSSLLIGRSVYEFVDKERHADVDAWLSSMQNEGDEAGLIELQIRRFDGETVDIEANSILVQYEGQSFIQSIARDITEKKSSERTVQQMAYYDALTGLPNRNRFNEAAAQSLETAKSYRLLLAVMFIDLDRFKYINDTMGHPVGDLLLKKLAERLVQSVREADTVSRLGGDEFIVLLPNTTHDQAAMVAQRMMANIARPFHLEGHTVYLTASIGIALYPDDGGTPDVLVKRADQAMYEAKVQGKNNYRFYNPSMNATTSRKLELERGLREAVEREQFVLYYQPKLNMASGKIVGIEALIRWNHPELGFITPNEFIPLAEQSGLIVAIGEWTLRTACRQNKAWQDMGYPPVRMAVNLSMLQFRQDDLIGTLLSALKEGGLAPHYLELEITESVAIQDQERVIEKLQRIKQLGIQISMDDFGTGYSSLGFLRQYPFDTIKIDRSFVRDLKGEKSGAAIVQSIIEMAHSLHMNVLAEGVETEEQMALLRARKCDEVQGYWLSKPLPADQFEAALLAGRK